MPTLYDPTTSENHPSPGFGVDAAVTSSSGGGITSGAGAPTSTPSSGSGIYIQTDSVPPGLQWEYYSGAWH